MVCRFDDIALYGEKKLWLKSVQRKKFDEKNNKRERKVNTLVGQKTWESKTNMKKVGREIVQVRADLEQNWVRQKTWEQKTNMKKVGREIVQGGLLI